MYTINPSRTYLLNEKAYEIVSGQSAKDIFKDLALKQLHYERRRNSYIESYSNERHNQG